MTVAALQRRLPSSPAPHRWLLASTGTPATRRLVLWVGLWTLAGLALRLVGARGGLWLDEAFSAMFARDAGTPARVFFVINHDNNHFLNTLWLLAMGWGAPPLAARALSIASGTLAIVVAGLFAGRRSTRAGALAAAAFALSPLIATYGMEARGYAPMVLALLVALWLVDGWLADPAAPPPARALGLVTALGMLAHLTFAYGLAVIGSWAAWELLRTSRRDTAAWWRTIRRLVAMTGHAAMAAIAVLGTVWLAARLSPGGFRFGSYKPFTVTEFSHGLTDMIVFAVALPWPAVRPVVPPAILVASLAAIWWTPGLGHRRSLYAIGILALPLAMAAGRAGNADAARYYLVCGVVLLLMLAEVADAALAGRRGVRLAAIGFLCIVGVAAATMDHAITTSRRGDPSLAIAAMKARTPAGADVIVDDELNIPVLAASAASAGYGLQIGQDRCRHARFLFVHVERLPFPVDPVRCGTRYRALTAGYANGLSGLHWQLYERVL